MPRKKINSRALRQTAEVFVEQIAENVGIPDEERGDIVTSLVRQWITYDGHATFFVDEVRQFYLDLGRTPLGKPCVIPEPVPPGWTKSLYGDWKISPDDMPEIIDQLNRGQGAEVVNADGLPLRLWVNPKDRSRGVEALAHEDIRPPTTPHYRTIAAKQLEQHLGEGLNPVEMDDLACSVANQWQRYDGHACVFLDGQHGFAFKFHNHGDGSCHVEARQVRVNLAPSLASYGFSPEDMPEVIAQINLGQEIEFRDGQGVRSRLWHDPKVDRLFVRPLDDVRLNEKAVSPPVVCPKCTGVLRPWQNGERQQTCRYCGQTVSLP